MGEKRGLRLVDRALIVIICVLAVLIIFFNKNVEEKRRAMAEETFCPSILRDIETARKAGEQIPAEVETQAEKCRQLGYQASH